MTTDLLPDRTSLSELEPDLQDCSQALRSAIEEELEEKSHILWMGRPLPGLYAQRGYWLFMVGLICASFGFWMVYDTMKNKWINPEYQIFELLGGLGLIIMTAPFLLYLKAKQTVYFITTQRLLIISSGLSAFDDSMDWVKLFDWNAWRSISVRSFYREDIKRLARKEKKNRYGDLLIDLIHQSQTDSDKKVKHPGFFAIPDVTNAFEVAINWLYDLNAEQSSDDTDDTVNR